MMVACLWLKFGKSFNLTNKIYEKYEKGIKNFDKLQ